jgi:hypothetical protein
MRRSSGSRESSGIRAFIRFDLMLLSLTLILIDVLGECQIAPTSGMIVEISPSHFLFLNSNPNHHPAF